MKKTIKSTALLLLAFMFIVCLASCGAQVDKEGLWENATYLKDTELGKGAKTATVEVKAGEQSITFTVHTDEEMLGSALLAHNLIEGESGLYTKVNGIVADYNVDQSYWGFYIDGEFAMTGLDTAPIAEGVVYQLIYTK